MHKNEQLKEQRRKNLQQKEERQLKELERCISTYSLEASQILEIAFSYFALNETYLQNFYISYRII